jgi:hypothetical protein
LLKADDPAARPGWERNGFRWFTPEELEQEEGVPTNVRAGARRALAYFQLAPVKRS